LQTIFNIVFVPEEQPVQVWQLHDLS